MFEGYGVTVTAAPVVPPSWAVHMPPAGIDGRPLRLSQLMPVARRTRKQKALELRRIARAESQLAGYKVEVAAAFARDSASDTADEDELDGVDEFFPDELALTLNCSRAEATTLAEVALTLVERLPATWTTHPPGMTRPREPAAPDLPPF